MKITRNDDGTFTAECEPGDVRYDARTQRVLVLITTTPVFGRLAESVPPDQRKALCEAVGAALLNAISEAPETALRLDFTPNHQSIIGGAST